jgi:thiamine biosynthesis protein ThiS
MKSIKIKLNGQERQVDQGTTVQNLLDELNIKSSMLVVEKNLEILPKEKYISCEILENDNLEIVGFFGGG